MTAPLTIARAASAFRAGTDTSTELTRRLLAAIDVRNPQFGAYVTVSAQAALGAAARADAELAAGCDRGPLHGVPIAVKDVIITADAPTTANSRVLESSWGGGKDATVVHRLREAGAVIIGKATTSEFACGDVDPAKGFRVPRNPWNLRCSPCGSSSGTAIALAAGLALGGIGTDSGGSIRRPSAANGTTGLKPTYGLVPTDGVVPLAHSLDTVGPMARTAEDCAYLLDAITGASVPPHTTSDTLDGLRVGLPLSHFFDSAHLDPRVRDAVLAAVDVLIAAGATVRDIDLPYAKQARYAGYLIVIAEGFAYHRRMLAARWHEYGRSTRLILARAALYTAGDLAQARAVGRAFRKEALSRFEDVDVVLTPTLSGPAPETSEADIDRGVVELRFTDQWNLAGFPALALPCGFTTDGMPLSMQLVGPPRADRLLLACGAAYQQHTQWHERTPELT
jgi:aspartyl-tRNA(Asn)/glutamyl-tRNA(Gln) amidotransferase subunit A